MKQGKNFHEIVSRAAYAVMLFAAIILIGIAVFPGSLHAVISEEEVLRNIGVDEKLDARIPLDLVFRDQEGKRVRLGDYFSGGPVILTLNFYECPMLCPLVFRNLVNTMGRIQGLSLDRDFRIVTVSFNPEETPARTRAKAQETYRMLRGVNDAEQRWPFLMGDPEAIGRLTGSVGFKYMRLAKDNFAHPAVLILLTSEGKVARYLYGIEQSPRDLKMALIEAAEGRIGGSTALNKVLLYCFEYDPVGKRYSLAAVNIMKIAGAAILIFLGILLLSMWRHEKRTGSRPE